MNIVVEEMEQDEGSLEEQTNNNGEILEVLIAHGKPDPNISQATKRMSHASNSNESTYSSHKDSGVKNS